MSFLAHLESVVSQVDGALACCVMGFDGIAVETHQVEQASDLDLTTTWVEYANIFTQLKNAVETLKTGVVSEISINTENVMTLVRMVTAEYFLVLALKPGG